MNALSFMVGLATIALIANSASAARILGVFVQPFKSHSHVYNSVMHGLLDRGHEVTIVGTYPLPADAPKHTFLQITPSFDLWQMVYDKLNISTPFEMHDIEPSQVIQHFNEIGIAITEHAFKHPHVQRLLHNSTDSYDLIVVEQLIQESFLMLSHQFQAPLVAIAAYEFSQTFTDMFGVFGAWSHVPNPFLAVDEPMNFWTRLLNMIVNLQENYSKHFDLIPQHQKLADNYFAHLPDPKPTIAELNRNISVLLMNGHAPMVTVRPNVPGLVDIGGVHIGQVKPLPADLQEFLDGATDGAVFISFGTGIRSEDMPEDQLNALINTFREFSKLRILWKWEDQSTQSRLPSNVKVMKWLPQNDILAHPNIRFFITHGGLLGTSEAVHHGVPLIGIPISFDQHTNIARAQKAGYAITVNFKNITEPTLRWAFGEMLENPQYKRAVERISLIYNDRPERPLERAVYWVEYVIRHKGATHLRSGGLDLNWFSYFLLDIIAFIALVALTVILSAFFVVRFVFRIVNGSKTHSHKHVKNIKIKQK